MGRTSIEWVLNLDNKTLGWVWNPITGCLNGCEYCYARKLANGRLRERYLANSNYLIPRLGEPQEEPKWNPFYLRFWPERLEELRGRVALVEGNLWSMKRKPRGIFVCNMSDLFGIGVPEDWTRQVMETIRNDSIDRFYLLTKRYDQLVKWSPYPDNVYLGVSITNQGQYDEAIECLARVKAKVKFISFEPLLESMENKLEEAGISLVIIGALTCSGGDLSRLLALYPELKPMPWGRRYILAPKVEWVRNIVEAADKAGVKVFLKNSLQSIILPCEENYRVLGYFGGPIEYTRWKLRQEIPGCKPV